MHIVSEQTKLNQLANQDNEGFATWLNQRPSADSDLVAVEILGLEQELTFEDFQSGANQSVEGKIGKVIKLTGDDAVGLTVGNYSRNTPSRSHSG